MREVRRTRSSKQLGRLQCHPRMVPTVSNGLILVEALSATATRTLATVEHTAERSGMAQRLRDIVQLVLEMNRTTTTIDVAYKVCIHIVTQ